VRAIEIIRGVLDLIDRVENPEPVSIVVTKTAIEPQDHSSESAMTDVEEIARLRQIFDLLPGSESTEYSNSANEKYADIESVIPSGTDLLKSKNPSDIRGEHASMYPLYQHDPREE